MPIDPDSVAAISQRLAEHAGLELPAWLVEARARSRIAHLGIEPAAYVALLRTPRGASELEELIEAVRTGESRLFRHRGQIAALVSDVIPTFRAAGNRAVKVWSAGCSTGQEPYTLAAVLGAALPGVDVSILATDVSSDALDIARQAAYPASAYADVPAEWRDEFVIDGDVLRVRPDVAARVTFERANLAEGSLKRGFDLVWCRNVLIYFTPVARRRVIDRLIAAMVPGGFLFVGYSESLRDVPQLRVVRAGDAVYYVRGERTSTPAIGTPVTRRSEPQLVVPTTTKPASPSPVDDTLVLEGRPNARELAAALSARLAASGLRRLVIDLDPAELLDDELAPVLARARAAARTAHVELVLKATRAGIRRWLARNALDGTGTP